MKIAVCGSGKVLDNKIAGKARDIGLNIAKHKGILLTGACHGYPNEAAKSAFKNSEQVIGYSPANNIGEHVNHYDFPSDNFTEIIFTGRGIPARNFDLISNTDSVILIDGKVGTLNEFTIAFHFKKNIGVLLNSGGISDHIKKIADLIDKDGYKNQIIYEEDPKKLVRKIFEEN